MRRNRSALLPAVAISTVLVGASLVEPLAIGTTTQLASDIAEPAAATARLAQAITACDLAEAETLLSEASQKPKPFAAGSQLLSKELILGLAAETCDQFSIGLEWLQRAPDEGAYNDWRLYELARSSIELGQFAAAGSVLSRLVEEYSSSPIFAQALLAASQLAEQQGDIQSVAQAAEEGRRWQLGNEISEALEVAAWRAGSALEDRTLQREAAVELLTKHPLSASELEVVNAFRLPDGKIEWLRFLTPDQLVKRAASLLAAGLPESALTTLESVPEAARGSQWTLASAETLTASGRGEEALAALESMQVRTLHQEQEREWQQAQAALEVSAPRSGRNLTSAQRQIMRDRAHRHLETAIAQRLNPERTQKAYRILFEDALEDDLFDQALEILRRLKEYAPEDMTGAGQLWRLGWKQYNEHNYSGAIGYWTELSALYPNSTNNRSGLYWTARAHDALGNQARSRQLLTEVADVPFTDFYRRHALRRLGKKNSRANEPQRPTEPWPVDPVLSRAQLLFSVGLHRAALVELEALAPYAEPRAASALEAEVLAAVGERRESIIAIKSVYPLLGTPFQGMAPEKASRLYYPLAYDGIIAQHSLENRLDRNLVLAMIRQESAFDPRALSWAGARGLMQVMPATGREIASRLGLKYTRERGNEPGFSIQLGTAYYRQVRSMFDEDDELSLAGYNAGPFRIKRLWRRAGANAELDRFLETLGLAETTSYVKRVLLFADSYSRLYENAG